MTVDTFTTYLISASYWAIKMFSDQLGKPIPFVFCYDVELNQSNDENPEPHLTLYLEDAGKSYERLIIYEVAALLCRDGKVPVWIDVWVCRYNKRCTVLHLSCSGRYTQSLEDMYYNRNGAGPFGVKISHNVLNFYKMTFWRWWILWRRFLINLREITGWLFKKDE